MQGTPFALYDIVSSELPTVIVRAVRMLQASQHLIRNEDACMVHCKGHMAE